MQVKPLFDKVVIKAIEKSETTESGIVLPATRCSTPSTRAASSKWTAKKSSSCVRRTSWRSLNDRRYNYG